MYAVPDYFEGVKRNPTPNKSNWSLHRTMIHVIHMYLFLPAINFYMPVFIQDVLQYSDICTSIRSWFSVFNFIFFTYQVETCCVVPLWITLDHMLQL